MTERNWTFDVSPSGTALTVSNVLSVVGSVPAALASIGTGTFKSSSAYSHQGGLSFEADMPSGSSSSMRLPFASACLLGALRFYHRAAAAPSASFALAALRFASGSVLRVFLNATGQVSIRDAAGVVLGTSSGSLTYNQLNRFEVVFAIDTASTGAATVQVFSGDSYTPYVTVTVNGVNLGTAPATAFDLGTPAGITVAYLQYFDSAGCDDGATVGMGPYNVPNTPPTVVASPAVQSVGPAGTPTVNFIATDVDGTIASRNTTFTNIAGGPSITGATTANPSFTAGAMGSLYIMQQVVTDNVGATGSASAEIRVPTNGPITPLANDGTGDASWANVGSAATRGEALSDGSDATYLESASVSATSQNRRFRLTPSMVRSTMSFTVRTGLDLAGSATLVVRLYEGATVRQTWTRTVTSTTPSDEVCELLSGTVAAITDWGNLSFEFGAVS